MSAQHPHAHGELVNENVHHEGSDINIRAIIGFIVVLTVVTLAIQLSMWGLFKVFNKIETKSQPAVSPVAAGPATPEDFPQPRLQTTPWSDLKQLRAEEQAYLSSYGWVDESGGIAHVPIDEAKAMLLKQGLPVRPDGTPDATEGTHFFATGESSGGRNLPAGGADRSGIAPVPSEGASPIPTPAGGGAAGNPPPQAGQSVEGTAETKPGGRGGDQGKKPGGGV
jgi:hypothetical protein